MGLFSTSFVHAADVHSARTAALGGAGHASPLLNDSIFLNPSFTSFLPSYSMNLTFLKFSAAESLSGRNYSVSVLDGRSPLFQAGLAYSVTEHGAWVHVGASKAFITRMGFGLGGKFFFPNESNHQTEQLQELVFSTTWISSSWAQVALVVDNLIQSDRAKSLNRYREFILGSKINVMDIVIAYLDPHYVPDLTTEQFGYELGLEFPVFGDVFLRTGTFKNALVPFMDFRAKKGFSFGAGWIGGRISLDYAMTRVSDTGNSVPASTAHVFSGTAFF